MCLINTLFVSFVIRIFLDISYGIHAIYYLIFPTALPFPPGS